METVFAALAELSKSAPVVAFAAFGVCTSLKEFMTIGPAPFLVLGLQTLLLPAVIGTGVLLSAYRFVKDGPMTAFRKFEGVQFVLCR